MARQAHTSRAADTRHKIQLGGLVIKAGLGEEDRAFILGLLLYGLEKASDPEVRARMRFKGQREFPNDETQHLALKPSPEAASQ